MELEFEASSCRGPNNRNRVLGCIILSYSHTEEPAKIALVIRPQILGSFSPDVEAWVLSVRFRACRVKGLGLQV